MKSGARYSGGHPCDSYIERTQIVRQTSVWALDKLGPYLISISRGFFRQGIFLPGIGKSLVEPSGIMSLPDLMDGMMHEAHSLFFFCNSANFLSDATAAFRIFLFAGSRTVELLDPSLQTHRLAIHISARRCENTRHPNKAVTTIINLLIWATFGGIKLGLRVNSICNQPLLESLPLQ